MSSETSLPVESRRLMSLDALRGADMFLLVGLTGIFRALPKVFDHPWAQFLSDQVQHPEWHGFTLYDLIFPLFIFIVGASLPFSFANRRQRGEGDWQLYRHIITRTVVLTLLGLVYWGTPGGAHPTYGYYSVLYRIAISYCFAALITMHTGLKGQALWAFGLLIGYWLATRYVPVPSFGAGNFTKEGCLQTYLSGRMTETLSPRFRYVFSITLIPSIANALFGVLAGNWLRSTRRQGVKTLGLLLAGAAFLAAGLLTSEIIPINKKMETTSFSLLTVGLSLLLLGVSYWLVDVRGWRRAAFVFVVVGMNPLVIYLGARLIDFNRIAGVFVGGFVDSFGPAAPLVTPITSALLMWLVLYYLYINKIFIKI